MQPESSQKFSPEELREIDQRLMSGVVSRAGVLSLLYCPTFAIYGYTSLEFLRLFKSDLTLFENLWPRLLFNALPSLLIGLYFRDYKTNIVMKAWIWVIGLPIIFATACMIYVWPLMWHGQVQLYSYVHAANTFIIITSLIVVSPSPKLLCAQIGSFVVFLIAPVIVILIHAQETKLLRWAMNDFAIALAVSIYAALMVYKLRRKISCFDLSMRKTAAPFLGTTLSDAIYNQKVDQLKNRRSDALIVKMDIRGYTDFYKRNNIDFVRQFMSAYHNIVSRNTSLTGGYWHKSIGDGQLASYGAMNMQADLSEIPGIESEVELATKRKTQFYFENIIRAATNIAFEFERLKEKFDVQDALSIGIAVARGEVEIRVQGDETKKELDIDGEVILRCSRLESYTKVIQKELNTNTSVLILSPELMELADNRIFTSWTTVEDRLQIRSYPEIQTIAYHIFRDKNERRDRILKLRAS